jgi:hypothetical protein
LSKKEKIMANIQETVQLAGKSPGECYELAQKAVVKAGYSVWKKREMAWLVIAKCTEGGTELDVNIMARPVMGGSVTLSSASEKLTADQMRLYVEKIAAAIKSLA